MVDVLFQEMELSPLYHQSMELWDGGNLPPGGGSYECVATAAKRWTACPKPLRPPSTVYRLPPGGGSYEINLKAAADEQ